MHNQQFTYKLGNCYDCPPAWSWNVESMHDFDIWLVCAGKGSLSCDGKDYKLAGGDCFIFKPGARIKATHVPDFPLQVVACHFDIVKTSFTDLTGSSSSFLHQKLLKPDMTAGLLQFAIQNGQKNMQAQANFWLSAAIMSFFEQQSEIRKTLSEGRSDLTDICEEISQHPNKNWSINTIAGKMRYSGDHCRRLFIKHTGLPPMEYVIKRRIERASFLLKYTDMSIAEIADELNYKTVFYFSRQFRKTIGIPPAAYRRK